MTTPAVAVTPAPASSTVVVTPTTNSAGYALALRVRDSFASMRTGAANIGRNTVEFLHLGGFADLIRRGWNWVGEHVPWLRGLVEVMGTGATALATVTSESGQRAIRWTGRQVGGILRWAARITYGAVDWTLRLFGRPGNNAADWMFDRTVGLQNWASEAAAPVVHRVADVTRYDHPNVKLVNKGALGLIAYRLITTFIVPLPLRILAGFGAGLLIAGKEGREVGQRRMDQASSLRRNPLQGTVEEKVARIRHHDQTIAHHTHLKEETLRYLTDPELIAMKQQENLRFAFQDAMDLREKEAKEEDKGVADELPSDRENPEASPRPVRILTDDPQS